MKGTIAKITLRNFVTFKDVEVRPHENLNIVIGPNGSGKSTIVSAIILGLGGKLKLADRGSTLSAYIRSGCKEAMIEIELRTDNSKNVVVSRVFNTDNRSVWRIDGNIVSSKQVDELVSSYHIQIGNLCQFLPQDKVNDFAKMNPQTLLENTQKSVGGEPNLANMHDQLKTLSKEIVLYEKKLNELQAGIKADEDINSRLSVNINNIKQRLACIEAVKVLKKKRAWAVYAEMKEKTQQMEKELAKVKAELQGWKKKVEPLEAAIAAASKKMRISQQKLNESKSEQMEKLRFLKNDSCVNKLLTQKIEDVLEESRNKISREHSRQTELKALQLQLNKMENDLAELNQPGDIIYAQIRELQQSIAQMSDQCNTIRHRCEDLSSRIANMDHEVRALDNELDSLQNVAMQRLQILKSKHHEVYQGLMWLRENKHMFRAAIHEPMLLEISLQEPNCAKYVETVIPQRDLVAFTFEDKEDMYTAIVNLRESRKLRLNFLHSGPEHTPSSQFVPEIPIEQLKAFGFSKYMSDVIEAPEAIKKYLLRTYKIHNIAIGNKKVDDTFERVPPVVKVFFSEDYRYSVSFSFYSKERLTQTVEVPKARYFTHSVSRNEVNTLQVRKRQLLSDKQNVASDLQTNRVDLQQQEEKLKELVSKRTGLQSCVQSRQALSTRIKIKKNHIISLEKEKIDIQEEEDKSRNAIKQLILEATETSAKRCRVLKEYMNAIHNTMLLHYDMEDSVEDLEKMQNDSQEIMQKCRDAETVVTRLSKEVATEKEHLRELQKEAEKAIADVKGNKNEYRNVQSSVKELDTQIQTEQAKADFIGEIDTGILQEFEKRQKKIEQGKQQVQVKRQTLERLRAGLLQCRKDWLRPLEELVAKISANFSKYFEAMGCAGEVLLTKGQNEDDYDLYGLNIRVKYRDGDQLHELSRNLQSGGEKSVATAIYMIALQELTYVPFRCVDEINQGMDPRNEREVFNFLMNAATRPNTSQYFLLTPKLLPGLKYEKNVKIILVNNGTVGGNYKILQCRNFCSNRKQRA